MNYQLLFIYLALMLTQVLEALELQKDETENGTINIHKDGNNRGLNEEYKTTTRKTIIASTKPVFKALTTTTLRPTTTVSITTSASLSPFRNSVPAQPSIGMRGITSLYNNRFLQIPSGYLPYPKPETMPFPIYQHLHPTRSNLVGYFYDFPVYKKQIRGGFHFNKLN